MPSTKKVGTSMRTSFKHAILNGIAGKIAGSLCTGGVSHIASMQSIVFVDMCAGDGKETEQHTSSPHILVKHADYCNGVSKRRGRYRVPADVHFIEKDANTIDDLKRCLAGRGGSTHFHKMDASKFRMPVRDPRETRIINIDPNSVASIPSPESWGSMLTPASFVVMTLGCNAAGVKMLPAKDREGWFRYTNECVRWFRADHGRFDLFFVSLVNDKHQWAYLFNFPVAWREKMLEDVQKWADKVLPAPFLADVFCYRLDAAGFHREVERHFRTQKELKERGCHDDA